MVNWESVRYFVALADSGTLSGAARMLNVEHATIARRVAALESETSLKLVDRRGRRFLLTEDGERIAAIA
ncbi:LysR family transcriptional regulator, partial [Bacillus safensis]|nr:LysR family transcriptional regulator [Bacillus safensis]